MSMKSKYSDCGCGEKTPKSKSFGKSNCCGSTVQSAPTPCCESHEIIIETGKCFNTSCNVVAGSDPFYLSFSNSHEQIAPLNSNEIFFYHPSPGLMRITHFDGESYRVELVDKNRAGGMISSSDCVHLTVQVSTSVLTNAFSRCVTGLFSAPANNQTSNIFIENGAGIPIGSTLTFTYEGEVGSYTVVSLVSSSASVYTYQVRNEGAGLVAGTTVDGGPSGDCSVPIDVITEIDLCGGSNTFSASQITACTNGSPRALKSNFQDSILVGNSSGGWVQKQLPETQCCAITQGIIKLVGEACPSGTDQVVLQNVGLDCFNEAWAFAQSRGQKLPLVIGGVKVTATAYNQGTRTLTIAPSAPGAIANTEFPAGTQICLEGCCDTCTSGPEITDHTIPDLLIQGGQNAAHQFGPISPFSAPTGVSHWLMGWTTSQNLHVVNLDATYFNNPSSLGPLLPRITDPLVLQQKICNQQKDGCDLSVEIDYNFEGTCGALHAEVRVDWEVASWIGGAETLQNGSTPNPFNPPYARHVRPKKGGTLLGPGFIDPVLNGSQTSFGLGGPGVNKVYPYFADSIRDFINLPKCSCALAIVWFFMRVSNNSGQARDIAPYLLFRRRMKFEKYNFKALPTNSLAGQGFRPS